MKNGLNKTISHSMIGLSSVLTFRREFYCRKKEGEKYAISNRGYKEII